MTDWWAEINNAPKDKPSREKFAAMVLAQNDLYMVTSDTTQVMGDLEAALASGRLERRHLTRCAENICRFLMNSPALLRLTGKEAEIELVNVPENAQLTSDFDIVYHDIKGVTTLPLTGISSEKGDSICLESQPRALVLSVSASQLPQSPHHSLRCRYLSL